MPHFCARKNALIELNSGLRIGLIDLQYLPEPIFAITGLVFSDREIGE
jgi:hypothetical protein